MGSTLRRTLKDYFAAYNRHTTQSSSNPLEREVQVSYVSLSASSTADIPVYCSDGPAYIRAIYFVPDTAITASSSNYWTGTVNSNSSTGSQTAYTTGFDTKAGYSQYARQLVWTAPANTVAEDGVNLSISLVKTSAPANFSGRFFVSYIKIES